MKLTPRHWERIHGTLTVAWFVMLPVAIFTGWIYAVAFISVISIYANFGTHFSAYQAARAEAAQQNRDEPDEPSI